MFKKGNIEGVVVKDIKKWIDDRGWLLELFRHDELQEEFFPAMAYVSQSLPDVARGPHEHKEQADLFCFIGPSNFKVWMWDNRPTSPTFQHKMVLFVGEDNPKFIIIPPGVVHAYKNIGGKHGIVINCPNRLYAGKGRKEPVDEIRHEEDAHTIFKLE
ncbi:dTDP-4-dehydrorhamnose 3,5-epimerase family protein [bacterium]|nr:dTDP-4-dehydrorhamnose 3,5-epimerase family protein [bacterium]